MLKKKYINCSYNVLNANLEKWQLDAHIFPERDERVEWKYAIWGLQPPSQPDEMSRSLGGLCMHLEFLFWAKPRILSALSK